VTGTATAPQNGHRPGAEFPVPAPGECPPQQRPVVVKPQIRTHSPRSPETLRNRLTYRFLRWLSPARLGCLRRNRRGVFAAAVTRYLKPVYTAVAADIGTSLVSRQPGDRPRKVTRDWRQSGRFRCYRRQGPCLQSEDARSPMASRSGAQGRLRPEHRKRRGSSVVQARGNATESNELSVARAGRLAARIRTRALG
jgi:hypothetical protein